VCVLHCDVIRGNAFATTRHSHPRQLHILITIFSGSLHIPQLTWCSLRPRRGCDDIQHSFTFRFVLLSSVQRSKNVVSGAHF
jgi:hypothetical protein